MNSTEFDRDEILTDFLTNYIDGNMARVECEAFEDYLSKNVEEREFARKALMGKKILSRFASHFNGSSVSA